MVGVNGQAGRFPRIDAAIEIVRFAEAACEELRGVGLRAHTGAAVKHCSFAMLAIKVMRVD